MEYSNNLFNQDIETAPEASPAPMPDPREVVESYQLAPRREVVEVYVQPRPPQKPAAVMPVKRRSRRGMWIFLSCLGILLLLAVGSLYLSLFQDDAELPSEFAEEEEYTAEVSIQTYPFGEGANMAVSAGHGEQLAIQEIYRRANPAVVTVIVQLEYGASIGTGVIFTEDGYLFTNYHVLAGGTDCSVTLASGATYAAKYVGGDSDNDIAVLKVNAKELPTAIIGDSDALAVGDTVYAIGNPLGVELRGTLTDGIVSAINRNVQVQDHAMTLIQTNAALNQGNSGGPLINAYGQVVGINTIKMMSDYSSVEGLGFALPMASVQDMVNDILETGAVRPEPMLGVTVSLQATVLSDGNAGVEVLSVSAGSASDKAGIQPGDIIVAAGGQDITQEPEGVENQILLRIRRQFNVGDEMPMTIWRDGVYLEVTLQLKQAAG